MMRQTTHPTSGPDRGFTLVESLICVVIVGVMLVAALRAVGASNSSQLRTANRAVGSMLAQALMDEIMLQAYENSTSPTFGPESGESARANFNDVDDYNNWNESPPKNLDATTMSNMTGWSRSVAVAWVSSSNPNQPSSTETGVKRMVVTVKRNNVTCGVRTALRTRAPYP
jgi:prepilin-type N-terminal cleavage/methylation domain-containing protein